MDRAASYKAIWDDLGESMNSGEMGQTREKGQGKTCLEFFFFSFPVDFTRWIS